MIVVSGLLGSSSGTTVMFDKLTETLSSRRIPHRPMAFHTSSTIPSPSAVLTRATWPASNPTLPWILIHIPPSAVVLRTSTRSGPRTTRACCRMSSGDALTARER